MQTWECAECEETIEDEYQYSLHIWMYPRHHPKLIA